MSHAMDKAMMELSLDEEDEPFDMPNLPQYRSCERNSRSLVGRILNPDCQKMPGLIRNMPRSWQKQGRVRGIALSKERFQFIFDHEHDLLEVLEKGVHTFNEWALAIDRWVEYPPADYLQFIPIWIQIRNLPINYYTREAITALGERIFGDVKNVAFDPNKPQIQDYVRILVRFDVSRPLWKSKVVNLPEGGSTVVHFNYERVKKRCYECQRLNHEKDVCPLIVRKRRDDATQRRERVMMDVNQNKPILTPGDPLFGVLSEEQVGFCKTTGRRKISPEVLDEMRRYLLLATEEDKVIRFDRVKSSVAEAEKDPLLQKTMLRLEAPTIFTDQVDKGKGIVFDFDLNTVAELKQQGQGGELKLMASAFKAGNAGKGLQVASFKQSKKRDDLMRDVCSPSTDYLQASSSKDFIGLKDSSFSLDVNSTEYGPGYPVSKPSGVAQRNSNQRRRRPYIKKRKEQKGGSTGILHELYGDKEGDERTGSKRSASGACFEDHRVVWCKEPRVIPNEGSPKSQ